MGYLSSTHSTLCQGGWEVLRQVGLQEGRVGMFQASDIESADTMLIIFCYIDNLLTPDLD
jgi:hypothetical protein